MKQKLRNLSAQANIIFAILAVFIFIAPLQWSGKVLGLIPGMEKVDDYLLQAIVETVILVIFLASHIYLGCGISLRKMQQDGPEAYTQAVFHSVLSVCCCFRHIFVLFERAW